ncbi:MAG TPA: phosphoribosylanthranilate isomerase [Steroidobacteraceae bacterium]|nr:phosphoribosylanthranilate isomerase [Steroidobacteraceae bacterium]
MKPFIKICCMASREEARLAISAGASAVGLVSAMPSGPGPIADSLIADIAAIVPPPIATFLLTCRQDADSIIEQHSMCRTSTLQLVDSMAPAELEKLRARLPGIRLVQVIHVGGEESIDEARMIAPFVDALLLDSGNQKLAVKELGGTGRVHDWRISRRIRDAVDVPLFLAGGLNAGNVAAAVAAVQPHGVDVCSGVRTEGKLDAAKLRAFVAAMGSGPVL